MVAGAWGGWWQESRRWMLVFSLLPSFMKTRITTCGVASFTRRPGLPYSAKSPWEHLPSTPGGVSVVLLNSNSSKLTVRVNSHDYLRRVLCIYTGILGIRVQHMNEGQIPCSPQYICKNRLPGRMPLFSFLLWKKIRSFSAWCNYRILFLSRHLSCAHCLLPYTIFQTLFALRKNFMVISVESGKAAETNPGV